LFATLFCILLLPEDRSVAPITGISEKNISVPAASEPIAKLQKNSVSLTVNTKDYRAAVLDIYFANNGSPLAGQGSLIIQMCDKYALPKDCTLIPAIAYAETKLCTTGISNAQYNCWGWGGSGENRIMFVSYQDSIENIAKGLHNGYGAILNRPDLIAPHYCGSACTNWITAVIKQQAEINNLAFRLGFPSLF